MNDREVAASAAGRSGSSGVGMTVKQVQSLLRGKGQYYGRPSFGILDDGPWVMVYIHSKHQWDNPQGQIGVMFSGG